MRSLLWVTLSCVFACNRQVAPAGAAETGSTGTTAGAEADDSDPEVCEEAAGGNLYYQCGDECVWLHANRDHCGACFNACRVGEVETDCREGRCAPFQGECLYPQDGVTDCAAYCRANGGRCELGDGACAWPYTGFIGSDRACDGVGPVTTIDGIKAACDEPIDWDARYLGEPLGGIRCCCAF